jgi:MFS family permease
MGGLLVAQPLAGALAVRVGSRRLVVVGAAAYALALVPIALAGSLPALAAAFLLLGTTNGVLDVSMNLQGLHVERRLGGRPIFAGLHAAFSFGALGGAAAGAVVAAAGVGVDAHLIGAALFGLVVGGLATRPLLEGDAGGRRAPAFARPSRALAAVSALAFCALLAEGAMNDWCAVFLADETGASDAYAALGLTVFSAAMGTGRLVADPLTERFGAVTLARAGGALAALGVGFALASARPGPALAGLLLAGLGLAAIFPLALRAAGSAPNVAAVSTLGYVAFLAGPTLIGGASELVGLRSALLLVVVVCLGAMAAAGAVRGSVPERAVPEPAR